MAKYLSLCIFLILLAGCNSSTSETSDTSDTNDTSDTTETDTTDAGDSNDDSASNCLSYTESTSFALSDTGQQGCYDENGSSVNCPSVGSSLYGQDAQYATTSPNFEICDDSVVVDKNTKLMWQKAHNEPRLNYADAEAACASLELGGFSDWRIPDIKEAFSIANFSGTIDESESTSPSNPYVFSEYFDIAYSEDLVLTGTHDPQMMGQTWTSTSRPDNSTINYFWNYLDGHLKSQSNTNTDVALMYRCVRGEKDLNNNFTNNGDGTVSDNATGLMWQTENAYNSANASFQFTWAEALESCEDSTVAGYTDWKLPDVKELQSIVDYTDADDSIDTSVFTQIIAADTGPFFWSSTTDEQTPRFANYVCFGHCWNYTMNADIHGPGAQRSSPKYDNGRLPTSLGDQEDLVQVDNYVRCVR